MKLTPSMKKRFDETVKGFIEQGVIPNYDDAVAKLDEIVDSVFAKKLLEKYKTFDNEWVQNFLIDHFRDEVGRGLLNPVMTMRMKVTSVRTYDAKDFGDDRKPTGKTIKTTKAFGTVAFKNSRTGKWDTHKPGQVSAVEKQSDALGDVLEDGKTYVLDVICARPDINGYIQANFGDRCVNIKEDENDDMPFLEEVLPKFYDKMPIHDAEGRKSKDKYEYKLIEGKVVNHPLMPGANNKRFSANFQLSDSSVTAEDLASKNKKAYLNVQCVPEMVSFGKDSIIMMLGVVQWNPDDFLGPAFVKNPPIIVPIVQFDLPQVDVQASSPSMPSRPMKAVDVIMNISQKKAMSAVDKVAKKSEPEVASEESAPEEQHQEEHQEEEKKPKRRTPQPEVDDARFLEECGGFGKHDAGDAGCKACAKEYEKKGKPEHHIYPACIGKSK